MRFVLGNRLLTAAGGTEVHLLTLAGALQRLGHEVVLYSPELGPFSDHVRRRGIEVVGELRELPGECDVVFAQDGIVVYDLVDRYPDALQIFRVCGDVYDFQLPPQLGGVIDLIVVLSERYARVAAACAVQTPVLRLRVPIDTDRLLPVAPIRARPRRAVLLGNYPERDDIVRTALESNGVEVTRIGAGGQRYDLAAALEDADIVFAKGRAALDAMACGRAVYVYDVFGGDGWVTPESYPALDADNFAGQATDRIIDVATLESDLADYDARMGVANRDIIAQHHGAGDHAVGLVAAITARKPHKRPTAPLRELSRLIALQWSWERITQDLRNDRMSLIERVQGAELRAGELEHVVNDARRRIADEVAATAGHAAHAEELDRLLAETRAQARAQIEELRAHAEASHERAEGLQARAEELQIQSEELQAQIDAMRATRAWRLAMRLWRWR